MNKSPVTSLCAATLALGFSFLSTGCVSDTVVKQSYVAPGVSSIKFSKVLVVAALANGDDRRLVEHTIAGQIRHVPAVASCELIPGVLGKDDKPALIQAIKDGQFDGVVVLRVTGADTQLTQGPSTASPMEYLVFSGFYTHLYDVGAYYASDRRSLGADRVFSVEACVFDGKTEKLLWSGRTQSRKTYIESQNVGALAAEVAQALREKLASQHLIP